MSGRVGGVVESSCMSYSDKADSDDHTMAAALVFLFSCRFWRRWTFLFLEFPRRQQNYQDVLDCGHLLFLSVNFQLKQRVISGVVGFSI